jgi:hypothetical protein
MSPRKLAVQAVPDPGTVGRTPSSACWTFTVDHVIPQRRGGTNARSKLVADCPDGNTAKGTSIPWPAALPQDVSG